MEGRETKDETGGHGPPSVLPLLTDLIFVSIAAYLLVGYALAFQHPISFLDVTRETFATVYLLMALAFLAVRSRARRLTTKPVDYLYTIVGFTAPLFFQPTTYAASQIAGAILEIGGLALVVGAFLCLNRSFGLAPQNRGVRTAGVYGFVRHPMYLGYMLAEAGYALDNFSGINIIVLAISVLFLILRLRAEEQLLVEDPAYRNYSKEIKWKLLPFIY